MSRNAGSYTSAACLTAFLLWLVPGSGQVVAQEGPTAAQDRPDSSIELQRKVEALEQKVKQLEQKASTQTAPAPDPTPAPAAPDTSINEVAERLKLDVFGDVGYQSGHYYGPTSTFELGEFNLLFTARLNDQVSVLGDVLMTSSLDNTIGLDVERLLLSYRPTDYLHASIGRLHTAIGYYNTAFDRGEYFQTAIGRPAMYEFDDQGGFLPMQDIGATLDGKIPSGRANLHYVFEVTNGRDYGALVEPVQNNSDKNSSKAVNFGLSSKPTHSRDLTLGFSLRHDKLSDVLSQGVSEIIPVAYAVYTGHHYEFLNEAMWVRHALPAGSVHHTPGFYSQISRGFGSFRPYFLYSYVNASLNDPIYGNPAEMPVVGRINGPSVGLRYDFSRFSAAKVQYQREDSNFAKPTNGLAAEISFLF